MKYIILSILFGGFGLLGYYVGKNEAASENRYYFETGAWAIVTHHVHYGNYGSQLYRDRVFDAGEAPQNKRDIEKLMGRDTIERAYAFLAAHDTLNYTVRFTNVRARNNAIADEFTVTYKANDTTYVATVGFIDDNVCYIKGVWLDISILDSILESKGWYCE